MEKGVEKRFEIDGRFILSLIRVHAFKFTMRSLILLQIQNHLSFYLSLSLLSLIFPMMED